MFVYIIFYFLSHQPADGTARLTSCYSVTSDGAATSPDPATDHPSPDPVHIPAHCHHPPATCAPEHGHAARHTQHHDLQPADPPRGHPAQLEPGDSPGHAAARPAPHTNQPEPDAGQEPAAGYGHGSGQHYGCYWRLSVQ